MDVLIRFGFSIEEIKNMMDTNDLIDSINDKEINHLIDMLEEAGCKKNHIRNIFICNPFVITRSTKEVQEIINKLYEIGLSSLYILFDSNPYLLNTNIEEFDKLKSLPKDEIYNYLDESIIKR